jgi:hypothetical protein
MGFNGPRRNERLAEAAPKAVLDRDASATSLNESRKVFVVHGREEGHARPEGLSGQLEIDQDAAMYGRSSCTPHR